jgi:hypothetical protein
VHLPTTTGNDGTPAATPRAVPSAKGGVTPLTKGKGSGTSAKLKGGSKGGKAKGRGVVPAPPPPPPPATASMQLAQALQLANDAQELLKPYEVHARCAEHPHEAAPYVWLDEAPDSSRAPSEAEEATEDEIDEIDEAGSTASAAAADLSALDEGGGSRAEQLRRRREHAQVTQPLATAPSSHASMLASCAARAKAEDCAVAVLDDFDGFVRAMVAVARRVA